MSRLWLLVHKGLHGACVFSERRDYRSYQRELCRLVDSPDVNSVSSLYAWSILPTGVALIVGLSGARHNDEQVLARFMTRLAVRHTCRKHGLTELPQALWSQSIEAVQVHPDQVWRACRFVEIACVRACLVATAASWPWSSFHDAGARRRRTGLRHVPKLPHSWELYLVEGASHVSQRVMSAGVTAGRVTYTRAP